MSNACRNAKCRCVDGQDQLRVEGGRYDKISIAFKIASIAKYAPGMRYYVEADNLSLKQVNELERLASYAGL